MSLTRIDTTLDTGVWHKVDSGVWFGKEPTNLYPLNARPYGRLIASEIVLDDPARWTLSVGGMFNTAHNLSPFCLGLQMADPDGNGVVVQLATPVGNSEGYADTGAWGIAYGAGRFFDQSPANLETYQSGHSNIIDLVTFPRIDSQTFTLSLSLLSGTLTFAFLLSGTTYELYTETSEAVAAIGVPSSNSWIVRIDNLIMGTAKDQYETVDDGEGGYNYVGSPVCVLDWVSLASVS